MSDRFAEETFEGNATAAPSRAMVIGVCLFLAAIVWVVFGQTLGYPFVNLDDDQNVYANPAVSNGLSLQAIGWAFTHAQVSRWVPLSTLAHMLDSQLYGMWAGGHHSTSVLFHTATAVLLFLILRQLTAAFWRSALVAALFAIHPLHVEAVAWVSTLQYTLSGFFFMLTLWAYIRYARRPWSPARYGAVVLLYTLALLAKEMLVTLPGVLLLLDFWPLHRIPKNNARGEPLTGSERRAVFLRLFLEKIPLLALSAVFCVITLLARRTLLRPFEIFSLPVRLENAVVAYAAYLGQFVYPVGLTAWYPHPGNRISLGIVVLSLAVVVMISAGVFAFRQKRPYLVTGWLWYLGMLVPVIGFVQGGIQERCDRYTYLSQIGIYIMIAWGAAEWCGDSRHRRRWLGGVSAIAVGVLIICARVQTSYWRNSETLWTHTLAYTTRNYVAQENLATALSRAGRRDEAIQHLRLALQLAPDAGPFHYNLGRALQQQGQLDEAVHEYREAMRVDPADADAKANLAIALTALARRGQANTTRGIVELQNGEIEKARADFEAALRLDPADAEAHFRLGNVEALGGRMPAAMAQWQEALRLRPDDAEAHNNFAIALSQAGRLEEAIQHCEEALRLKPDYAEARDNLAELRAMQKSATGRK